MKRIAIIKAHADYKQVGAELELEDAAAETLVKAGYAEAAETYQLKQQVKAAEQGRIKDAIVRAKARDAVEPKDETVLAKHIAKLEAGSKVEDVVELIDSIPGKDEKILSSRLTDYALGLNGHRKASGIEVLGIDVKDVAIKACQVAEPAFGLLKQGKTMEAAELGRQRAMMLREHIMPIIRGGGDFSLRDMVRATDVTDANVGVLAGSLVLMRNLGYLKNMINFMPYISTDLRNEPALFNQPVYSRYIVVPSVSSYNVPTTTGSGTTFAYTGGWTDSTASTKDVSVTINNHKGVQITFPTSLLGETVRPLFAEQFSAQTYALGEQIVKDFLIALFGPVWTGIVTPVALGGNAFNLQSFVSLKNRASLCKIPPVGRFALLHSTYHDQVLADTNLVTAKAIMALVNKDLSALESGELPILYGVKPLESQLALATNAINTASTTGVLGSATIGGDGGVTFPGITAVGFLGNMSSMLMAARIPQDYTQAFKDIPATAAIEIVTDPDSGLSMLNCKYVNHQLAQVSNRLSLMYGFAQGDPRTGFILTP